MQSRRTPLCSGCVMGEAYICNSGIVGDALSATRRDTRCFFRFASVLSYVLQG